MNTPVVTQEPSQFDCNIHNISCVCVCELEYVCLSETYTQDVCVCISLQQIRYGLGILILIIDANFIIRQSAQPVTLGHVKLSETKSLSCLPEDYQTAEELQWQCSSKLCGRGRGSAIIVACTIVSCTALSLSLSRPVLHRLASVRSLLNN